MLLVHTRNDTESIIIEEESKWRAMYHILTVTEKRNWRADWLVLFGWQFVANALGALSNSTLGATVGISANLGKHLKNLIDKTTLGQGSVALGTCSTYRP